MTESLKFERAVVYTPQPGDKVILELSRPASPEAADRIRQAAEAMFGSDVQILILDGVKFAGVVSAEQP